MTLADGQVVVMSDTVGFIHKLPHQLVDAFRATLEEVTRADALLVVVDQTDPRAREHLETVWTVLEELGAGGLPRLVALNKVDMVGLPTPEEASPAWERVLRPTGVRRLRKTTERHPCYRDGWPVRECACRRGRVRACRSCVAGWRRSWLSCGWR